MEQSKETAKKLKAKNPKHFVDQGTETAAKLKAENPLHFAELATERAAKLKTKNPQHFVEMSMKGVDKREMDPDLRANWIRIEARKILLSRNMQEDTFYTNKLTVAHNLVNSKQHGTIKTVFNAKTKSMTDVAYKQYLGAMPRNDVLAISWYRERARTNKQSERARDGRKWK